MNIGKSVVAVAAVSLLTFLPDSASANSPFCGMTSDRDWQNLSSLVTGSWQVKDLAGWAQVMGMVMPFGADEVTEEMHLSLEDGKLSLDQPETGYVFVLDLTQEERWSHPAGVQAAPGADAGMLSPDDAALAVAGCDQMELPRATGRMTHVINGTELENTLRLVLLDEQTIYGWFGVQTKVSGMLANANRAILLTRSNR